MKLGIIADIHEDILRLKQAISILEKNNCDEIICLGDIVGYCIPYYEYFKERDAKECISIIKSNCNIVVIGNHDLYAIKKIPEFKAGFNYPDNWYALDFEEREKLSNKKIWLYEDDELSALINKQDKEYLHSLPEYKIVEFQGIRFLFSHFPYPDFTGSKTDFLKNGKDTDKHFQFMKDNNCLIGICGHAHIDGFALAYENELKFNSFGKYKLKKRLQCLCIPCVVYGKHENGLMIFDADTFAIEIIPLSKQQSGQSV